MKNIIEKYGPQTFFYTLYLVFGISWMAFVFTITGALQEGTLTFYDFFITHGDSASAVFSALTFLLIVVQIYESNVDSNEAFTQSTEDRKMMLEENIKNRKIARLKEQLDFYKIIYFAAESSLNHQAASSKLEVMHENFKKEEVRLSYPQCTTERIYDEIVYYYDNFHGKSIQEVKNNRPELREVSGFVATSLDSLCQQIVGDFIDLSSDYRKLTHSR